MIERFSRIVERINPRKKTSSINTEMIEKTKIAGISNNAARIRVVALSILFTKISFNNIPAMIGIPSKNNGRKKYRIILFQLQFNNSS
jgi:hypothetical protein